MRVSGTIKNVSLNGIPFSVPGDIDATINYTKEESEGIPSTGKTMHKITLRVPTIESLILLVEPREWDTLRTLSAELTSFPMSVTLADGSVLTGTGRINFENVTTAENRATITLIPDDNWVPFVA